MAIFQYSHIIFITLCTIYFIFYFKRIIRNSPLAKVFRNMHRAHEKITQVLNERGGTYLLRGPWFFRIEILFTSDPANIQHIFSKRFSNYPKGTEFRNKFEILGDGIFSSDFEMWELQRRTILSLISHAKFHTSLERNVWEKIETGLIPVLDYFSGQGIVVDLQEIFQRFAFDNICQLVLEYDPGSLSAALPYIPCEKAFSVALQPLMYRHVLPERIWKLQKWLKIGNEKKLTESWKAFDDFLYPIISSKEKNNRLDVFTAFENAYENNNNNNVNFSGDLRKFLRDSLLGLLFAGRDTTSTCITWLFYLIATNPLSESKILDEIEREIIPVKNEWRFFNIEESKKLVYLHACLCESLRLFPPLALEYKSPIESDTLPSGHFVSRNSKVVISFYTVGRSESVWGKDCLEFKPERWITPRGGIKHEPSYKFPAFNVGPRTCLGKEMSFIQMKMVAATIVYRYRVRLVDGHLVVPRDSLMLHAKNGLKVRLFERNV
ncbi:hypothetical protein ABFS82_08G161800 [Erythranthe guttata]|nr:PREDICTED: alkane hydroxylase MAH1-like [Erythranthe guttata]|eukprot:XP_012841605.1 PREDICTED: alkane hydroxylase MAH1-like [Erythranthe guttata]